jgi:hypothetical protein
MSEALESSAPSSSSQTKVPAGQMDASRFAERLWGDVYFDKATRKFTRKAQDPSALRTFVMFVLEPIYKLYAAVSVLSLRFFIVALLVSEAHRLLDGQILTVILGSQQGYRGAENNTRQALNPPETRYV